MIRSRTGWWGMIGAIVLLALNWMAAPLPSRAADPGEVPDPIALAACPTTIVLGVVCESALSAVGEVDSYTIAGSANDVFLVRAIRTSGAFNTTIRLVDANDNNLAGCYDTTTPRALFACTVSTNGPFTLRVFDYYNRNIGNYQLYVQKLNSPSNVTAVSFGQMTSAALSTTIEQDFYSFEAEINDQIDLRVLRTSGEFSAQIGVYDTNGNRICNDVGGNQALINACAIPANGRYYAVIDDYYVRSTGNYQWFIQRRGRAGQAAALTFGERANGALSSGIGINVYTFSVEQNDQVLFRAQRSTGDMSLHIRVYDRDGNRVCYDVGGARAVIEPCVFSAAGTYNLFIDDYYVRSTGAYALHTQRINNPLNARVAQFGQRATDSIDAIAAVDTFTFNGRTNDVIGATMTRTSGAFTPRIRIFDAGGAAVCNDVGGASATIRNCTLKRDGRHTMLVDDYYLSGVGNYTLDLTCVTGSCNYRVYLPLLRR